MNSTRSVAIVAFTFVLGWSAAVAETLVVRAARMLDVESGRLISPATIVVDGEHIAAINPDRLPAGAETIDLGDVTLLPGLIDVHTHLTYDLEGDWVNRDVHVTAADRALTGVPNARLTLMAGFTTVRDLWCGWGFADVSLMRAIDDGRVLGPRMIPSGHALSITGGHCEVTGFAPGILEGGPKEGVADGIPELLKAVRYQIKHGAKVIKVCATAGVLSFEGPVGAPQYSEEELRVIVEEAARHGILVAAHAHGTAGIMNATRAGVASIEHGSILTEEALALMKKHGTYLVPNMYINDMPAPEMPEQTRKKWDSLGEAVEESFRLALRSGVKIAFGTDSGVYPHGVNAREFDSRVRHGMKPLEAIRSATLYAADLLRRDDLGVLAAGRLADVIAVPGDPLADVTVLEDVRFVMKGGEIYKSPEPARD